MYTRTKENQNTHDKAVASWAQVLLNKGWKIVYADLPNKAKPPKIGGYIPDIYGVYGSQEIIIEVETEDSKNSDHTKMQINAFNLWKSQKMSRKFLIKIA